MIAPHAYGSVARSFHWLIAVLLVLQIPLAFYMVDQPLGPDKLGNYATHKSIGLPDLLGDGPSPCLAADSSGAAAAGRHAALAAVLARGSPRYSSTP